jgi:hypothetical protein
MGTIGVTKIYPDSGTQVLAHDADSNVLSCQSRVGATILPPTGIHFARKRDMVAANRIRRFGIPP